MIGRDEVLHMGGAPTLARTARRTPAPALLGLLLLVGCSDTSGPDTGGSPFSRPHDTRVFTIDPAQPAFAALTGATAFHGIHDGIMGDASYRVEVPDTWNGTLVMWAHGYRGETPELLVSSPPSALRSHLIANGYAWAASSFSANYYDARAGIEDTNALALAFENLTSRATPSQYYIAGASMGGHVAVAAVEVETLQRAASVVDYSAALSFCGVVADNELLNYFYAVTIAAQELAGMPVSELPDYGFPMTVVPTIRAALWTDFASDAYGLTSQGEKFRNALMHLSGGPRPTFDNNWPFYLDLLFDRGSGDGAWTGILGGVSVNTTDIVYQLDSDPALSPEEVAFNGSVYREDGDFLARNPLRTDGVRAIPIVEGEFDVPVLSVHTLESRVPFRVEQIYAARAMAQGNDDLLVQRVIRSAFHCDFDDLEWTESFEALANWEQNGIVPGGDDVLDPAAVSDPSYGCTYTTATRAGIAACPRRWRKRRTRPRSARCALADFATEATC